MPIPFTCPHCGLKTSVAEQYAGQTGPCAGCGKPVTVPPLSGTPFAGPQKSGTGVVRAIVVGVVALLLLLACLPMLIRWVGRAPGAERRSQCTNNLKLIALALHNYHSIYKCFPPAVITDKDGKPMRSWRVAILPFMEQKPLYDRYNFNEPWDGPRNRALAGIAIPTYRCPSETSPNLTETNYVMIVGKGTIGGTPNEIVGIKDITDGTSNTILVVEVTGTGIHWMEPRDLSLEELSYRLNDGSGKCICSRHTGGANVALADGSVRFLGEWVDAETLRRLILRSDGKPMTSF